MTAIDLRTNTFNLLQGFDQTDTTLWQKVLNAVTHIYYDDQMIRKQRREEQRAKIRQMVGVFQQSDVDDWKQVKEEALTEKYR